MPVVYIDFQDGRPTEIALVKNMMEYRGLCDGIMLTHQRLGGKVRPLIFTDPLLLDDKVVRSTLITPQLGISLRIADGLKKNGKIYTLGELASRSERDLLELRNFGVGSLREVIKLLAKYGLSLSK